jgi:hypothetical protein
MYYNYTDVHTKLIASGSNSLRVLKSTNQTKLTPETNRIMNGKRFSVKLTDKNNNSVPKARITLTIKGVSHQKTFKLNTNSDGYAGLRIKLNPGTYTFTYSYYDVHTKLGASGFTKVKVYNNKTTLKANNLYMIVNSTGKFTVKLTDVDGDFISNKNVTITYNGKTYNLVTDANGEAILNISNLTVGTHRIIYAYKDNNPTLSSNGTSKIIVVNNITKISAGNLKIIKGDNKYFTVSLKDQFNNPLANQIITITIAGTSYNITTNSKGIASKSVKYLAGGNYTVKYSFAGNEKYPEASGTSNILVSTKITGISIDAIVNAANWVKKQYSTVSNGTKYSFNKYGVSSDGKYIMAIGRPSATGELSKYGYTFYRSVFKRVCPLCGSTKLFWSIFWAGNEYDNYGTFPATGNKEGGSAEGHIFCADCDADYSCIDGLNHVSSSTTALTKIVSTIKVAKSQAYVLLAGNMTNVDIVSSKGKIPSTVLIENSPFTLCQYFYYACRAISQLNSGNTNDMLLISVATEPDNPDRGDVITNGKLTKSAYVDSATRTYKYILNNNQGPNYSTTTVGRVSYNSLVKLFTEVLIYYGKNKKLPSTITVNT